MKPGSLVELVKPLPKPLPHLLAFVIWLPVMGEVYTVRELSERATNSTKPHLALEEGCVGNYMGVELGLPVEFFRELLPPMDLSELLEQPELLTA